MSGFAKSDYAILFARALTLINYGAANPSVVELAASDMYSRAKLDPTSTTAPGSEGTTSPRESWREWGEMLRRYQLSGIATWLLEAGRPFAILSAQLLYVGSPFLGTGASRLARLLESDEDAREFVRYLEEGVNPQHQGPGAR